MKAADRLCGWLLVVGAILHTVGTLVLAEWMSGVFVWALSGSVAAMLTATLNLLRAARPADRAVALLATGGTVGWLIVCVLFAINIHHALDPRVVVQAGNSLALLFFCVRTLSHGSVRQNAGAFV